MAIIKEKVKIDPLESLLSHLSDKNNLQEIDSYTSEIFVFASVDIVNSTIFKTDSDNWPDIYDTTLREIVSHFETADPHWRFWKSSGDEVLLCREIHSLDELLMLPQQTFTYIQKSQSKFDKNYQTRNTLHLKGTLWMARISANDDESRFKNIIIDSIGERKDFLGTNIDEGFRISQYTSQKKLVIDPKICYILSLHSEKVKELSDYSIPDRIKIVGYRSLKGLFKGRIYPIIWYSNDWTKENLYLYDEHTTSDIVKEIKDNGYTYDKIDTLPMVLDQLNYLEECEKIHGILCTKNPIETTKDSVFQLASPYAIEVHLSVACIDNDGRVLLLKRNANRLHSQNQWEYGCAKCTRYDDYKSSIQSTYKEHFNVDIVVEEQPLRIYNIMLREPSNSKGYHIGVLFWARFDSETIALNTSLFDAFRLVSEEELGQIYRGEFTADSITLMEGVYERLAMAFDSYNKKAL